MSGKKKSKRLSPPRRAVTRDADAFALGAPLSATEALLSLAAPAKSPGPHVKAALMARIAASKMPAPEASGEVQGWQFSSARSDSVGWLSFPFPGVKMKESATDDTTDTVFVLIEIAPGARFPDHEHDSSEFGIVLSGDVTSGGRLLKAGDTYFSKPGNSHHEVISPNGCTALVTLRRAAWQHVKSLAVISGGG